MTNNDYFVISLEKKKKIIAILLYVIAIIIFLFGHFGNLAINLLGSYVHTSRLQYLEFFTKFYQGGGKPFNPFAEKRLYTYLEKF